MYLANGKKTHQPLDGPAFAVDFLKIDGSRYIGSDLPGVSKSVISMWPVRDKEEAAQIYDLVSSRISLAYANHYELLTA